MRKILLIFVFISSFTLSAFGQSANESLALGNPSDAKARISDTDNYLVPHTGYTISYNKSRGAANWVAWHLTKSDVSTVERSNAFAPDQTLPSSDWWIKPNDYTGSGYDRGHLCPSKDRSNSDEANRETFLMSNMQPQTPKLNQKTWNYLESYERELTRQGNEEYIFAGCYGDKGKIAGKVTIPTNCWKIIVVLSEGDDDLKRVDKTTRVIAVNMPNDETVSQRWRTYLTTVDDIEEKTGYDFLSKLSKKVQKAIESVKDTKSETGSAENDADEPVTPTPVVTDKPSANQDKKAKKIEKTEKAEKAEKVEKNEKANDTTTGSKKTASGGRFYLSGSRGGCYYLTESGKKSYVDKKFCENTAPFLQSSSDKTKETNQERAEETKAVPAQSNKLPDEKLPAKNTNSDGRIYIRGSCGSCYYLTASGKKVYVTDKTLCQ